MNNKIYCSTGTMVGRVNDFDLDILFKAAPEIECDGFEFMFYPVMYERMRRDMPRIKREMHESDIRYPVTHLDKDIGIYLSCSENGYKEKALDMFRINCEVAADLGSFKTVLHLWGGLPSDKYMENNISLVEDLYDISEEYGLILCIENVPCALFDPLTHWKEIMKTSDRATFIYDTRFSAFHELHDEFINSGLFESSRIAHMHVSDFVGPPHDFASLRPIPHLGKGIAGLDALLSRIAPIYHNSITLESPEIHPDTTYPERINEDIRYIRERTQP